MIEITWNYEETVGSVCQNIGQGCETSTIKIDTFENGGREPIKYNAYHNCVTNPQYPHDSRINCCNCGGGVYTPIGPFLSINTAQVANYSIIISGTPEKFPKQHEWTYNLTNNISIQVKESAHCIDYFENYTRGLNFTFHKFECINDKDDANDCQLEFTILDENKQPITDEEALPVILHDDGNQEPRITLSNTEIVRNKTRYIKGCIQCVDNTTVQDSEGNSCEFYTNLPEQCGVYDTTTFKAKFHCCSCRSAHQNESDCAYTEKIQVEVLPLLVFPNMTERLNIFQDVENLPFEYYVRFEAQEQAADVSYHLVPYNKATDQAITDGLIKVDNSSIQYGEDSRCTDEVSDEQKGVYNQSWTESISDWNNSCIKIVIQKTNVAYYQMALVATIQNYSNLTHTEFPFNRTIFEPNTTMFSIFVNGTVVNSETDEFDEVILFGASSGNLSYYLKKNPTSSTAGEMRLEIMSEEQFETWDEQWQYFINDTKAIEQFGEIISLDDEPQVQVYPGVSILNEISYSNGNPLYQAIINFDARQQITYRFRLRACLKGFPPEQDEENQSDDPFEIKYQQEFSKLYICTFSTNITFLVKENPLNEPYFYPYLQDFYIEFDPKVQIDPSEIVYTYDLPPIINPQAPTQTQFQTDFLGIDENIMKLNQESMTIDFFNINNDTQPKYVLKNTHISDESGKMIKLERPQQLTVTIIPKYQEDIVIYTGSAANFSSGISVDKEQDIDISSQNLKDQQYEDVEYEPIELMITQFDGEGQVTIDFSQDLVVPERIVQLESLNSRLLREQIGGPCSNSFVGEDLKKCLLNEYLNQVLMINLLSFDEDFSKHIANLTEFGVEFKSWTESDLIFDVIFDQPTQVSQNIQPDKLVLNVIEPSAFKLKKNPNIKFEPDKSDSEFKMSINIPRQMPHGINEDTIKKQAQEVSKWSYIILILQFLVQLVLKGRIKQMLILFFTMQLLKCIYIYGISLPGNASIVVEQVQKTVDFEMLSLQHLLVIIESFSRNKDEDTKFTQRYEKLMTQAESGMLFQTPEFFKNVDITLVIFAFMLMCGIIFGLVYLVVQRSRELIKEKFQGFKKYFIWNGFIDALNIGYINYLIIIVQNTRDLQTTDDDQNKALIISQICIMSLGLAIFLVIVIKTLFEHTNEELRMKKCLESFGSLYSEVNLNVGKKSINKYIFPIQLTFRLIVVMIPLITTQQAVQVQLVQFAIIIYLMIVFGEDRLFQIDRFEAKMRLLIDFMILISFQTLYLFVGRLVMKDSDCNTSEGVCLRQFMGFIDNTDLQFSCGYVLMLLCVCTLSLCVFTVMVSIIKETSCVKVRYIFFMFMAKKGYQNCAKRILMRTESSYEKLKKSQFKRDEIEKWVEKTYMYRLNPRNMIPLPAGNTKSTSKFIKEDKEQERKMIDEQALDNLLCLENLRFEQIRFVLEDQNNRTTADYRIFLRIDWSYQVNRIIQCQEKLLRDVDESSLTAYNEHAKNRGLVYDKTYFEEFKKNYICLDINGAVDFLEQKIIKENNHKIRTSLAQNSQLTQVQTRPKSKKKKTKKKLKAQIASQEEKKEHEVLDKDILIESQITKEAGIETEQEALPPIAPETPKRTQFKKKPSSKSNKKQARKQKFLQLELEEIAEESLRAQERQSPLFQKKIDSNLDALQETVSNQGSEADLKEVPLIQDPYEVQINGPSQELPVSQEQEDNDPEDEVAKELEKQKVLKELEQEFGKIPGQTIMTLLWQQYLDKIITMDEYYHKIEFVEIEYNETNEWLRPNY